MPLIEIYKKVRCPMLKGLELMLSACRVCKSHKQETWDSKVICSYGEDE